MSAVLQSEPTASVDSSLAALRRAADILGNQAKLAETIDVTPQMVSQLMQGLTLHAKHCPVIEHATAEQVKCEDLRPDIHWVRGDSGEILGFITPLDNATPAYIRASMMARAREQAGVDPMAWIPEGLLQGGTLVAKEGQVFNGQNGRYVPDMGRADCMDAIAADAVRLVDAGGECLTQFCDHLENPAWGCWQLFELAGQAIRHLHAAGHFARLDTLHARRAYLLGCMHSMSEQTRAEALAFHNVELRLRELDGEEEWNELVAEIAEIVDDDRNTYDIEYGHAYGIMHTMTSAEDDILCAELIEKHGFNKDSSENELSVNVRLNNLHAEVQGILRKRATPAFDPCDLTDAGDWTPPDDEWSPPNAHSLPVDRCLNDASCLLAEAEAILRDSDVNDQQSGALRLVGMAHVLNELGLKKLLVAGSKAGAR